MVEGGIRSNTKRTYTSAQKQYLEFCYYYKLQPFPCSENTLLTYIGYLHRKGLKGSTVRVYLAAVRHLHVVEGWGNPLEGCHRVSQAIRAMEIQGKAPKQKLAITMDIMDRMRRFVYHTMNYDNVLIWASMTLAFYGCLRCSEFTVPDKAKFVPTINLTVGDVLFDQTPEGLNYVQISIKRSKTDKKNSGVQIKLGCTETKVCAYCAMSHYLQLRGSSNNLDPLFIFSNQCILTRSLFIRQTRFALSLINLPAEEYSGHSFRSGGATTAAAAGLADWEIKVLGRWSSEAYQRYIRTPLSVLVGMARRMAAQSQSALYNHKNPYFTKL